MEYTLYPISLREALPYVPIPLTNGDPDIPLDLPMAIQEIDRRALYNRMIDYARPLEPPLTPEDVIWVHEIMRAANVLG